MIIRKIITTIIATIISMTLLLFVLFDEGLGFGFVITALFTSAMFLPFILLYGVPVTFFSDYVTNRFTGGKRSLLAFAVHLLFGIGFPFILELFVEMSEIEFQEYFMGAVTFSFFFWVVDEVLRHLLSKPTKKEEAA